MQISRHWRMNSQRYRLMGVRYQNGDVSLQARPVLAEDDLVANGQNGAVEKRQNRKAAVISAA